MSKEKDNERIKENIEAKIDLLDNILASEKDIDILKEVDDLNTKYFQTLENLKEARPVFTGCDEAFISVANKLLRNFELVYSLLEAQYRGEIKRRIAFLEAVNERIEPFYWDTKWRHKPRQNYAATLVDMEADEVMKKVFAKKENEIIEKYYAQKQEEESGEWEIVEENAGESSVESAESPQNAPESEKTVEDKQDGAAEALPAEGEIKGKKKGKKGKKEGNKDVREGDQT